MTTATANPKAFAVWFKDLARWDVAYFRRIQWSWPEHILCPLGQSLVRKTCEVEAQADKTGVPIIEKISFGGDVSLADVATRTKYKGRLFWAEAGELIYSKIRVKQGSLAIVPPSMPRLAVSAEYPVYSIKSAAAIADYLTLVLKSQTFQKYLEGLSHGGSTKTRLHPTEFERLTVPLPALSIQRAIVDRWQKAQAAIAKAQASADALEAAIGREILNRLGIQAAAADMLPKVFAVCWNDLERWSVDYLRRNLASGRQLAQAKYRLAALGDIARVSYGLQKCPGNRPGAHARPYLRVANVQAGRLDLGEIKYIEVPDSEMEAFRLKAGDLLVCEGNSADLVGRPAIWNDEIPDCVHQNHVLKVRMTGDAALPHYVLEYMHTSPARNYFRSRAKQTTNLASINSNDLRGLPLPLPPLKVQRGIVEMVAQRRAEVARERQAAAKLSAEVVKEVEEMILGTRPAKGANA